MKWIGMIFIICLAIVLDVREATPTSSYSQNNHCGNGLTWQFQVGDIAWINLEPPLIPLKVREQPEGNQTGSVEPGERFRIIDGPECTSDGLSWWKIWSSFLTFGWVAEGEMGKYFIEPFNLEGIEYYSSNFNTQVTLNSAAPIVNSYQQIFYGGQAGGGGCIEIPLELQYEFFDWVYAWDISSFENGEPVQISVYRPDGSIFFQENLRAYSEIDECPQFDVAVGFVRWQFDINDPPGVWRVEFTGAVGHAVTYKTLLTSNSSPLAESICPDEEYTLVLDGFEPQQRLKAGLFEAVSGQYDTEGDAELIYAWDIVTDDQGQLLIAFSDVIVRSPLRSILLSYPNGEPVFESDFEVPPKVTRFSCIGPYEDTSSDITPPFIGSGYLYEGKSVEEWTFEGEQNQIVSIKMELLRNTFDPQSSNLDPILRLIDPDDMIVAENDDATDNTTVHDALDAHLDGIILPKNGTYTILASAMNNGTGEYKLTVEYTDTPSSSATNSEPGFDFSTQETLCHSFMAPRLQSGGQGHVIDAEPNSIRAGIGSRDILGQIPPGAIFNVLAGPECPDWAENVWWRVEYNGITGWTAEGYNGIYWLEPVP